MNTISWFLYSVDVLGTLGSYLNGVALVSTATTCLFLLFAMFHFEERYKEAQTNFYMIAKRAGIIALVSVILAIVVPSEKTMYLIMGSEVSEEVVNSETGKRVQNAINKKLDEYLDVAEKAAETK